MIKRNSCYNAKCNCVYFDHLQVEDVFHLENLHLSVKVNASGNIVSLVHKGTGRYVCT